MYKILLTISVYLYNFGGVVFATDGLLPNPAPKAGNTLMDFIHLLIKIMQMVGTPLLACAVIYSGFLVVTAGGNETELVKAKKWVIWTLVGGIIILGAGVIADMACGTAKLFDATISCV